MKFKAKSLLRMAMGAIGFALLLWGFYREEDWRGRSAWMNCQQDVSKRGDSLNMPIPPAIPDEQNFAMTPVIAWRWSSFLDKDGNRHPTQPTTWSNVPEMILYHTNDSAGPSLTLTNQSCWVGGHRVNLEWWQSYYRYGRELAIHPRPRAVGSHPRAALENEYTRRRPNVGWKTNYIAHDFPVSEKPGTAAADVLFALRRYAPAIEEMRVAAARPLIRLPVHYQRLHPDDLVVPALGNFQGYVRILALRAVAELRNDQASNATDDVLLGLRLTRFASEPLDCFSSWPYWASLPSDILQPVWEGLADHRWSEEQINAIDSELAQMNFIRTCERNLKARRAQSVDEIDEWRWRAEEHFGPWASKHCDGSPDAGSAMLNEAFRLAPAGWYDQNRYQIVSLYQQLVNDLDPINAQVRDARRENESEARRSSWKPSKFIADLLFNPPAVEMYAYAQAQVNLARVACALERYRMKFGEFPKALNALAPEFMDKVPGDVIAPGPLHYKVTNGTNLLLYSVGWNGTDEHGAALLTYGRVDIRQGDWVWRYR